MFIVFFLILMKRAGPKIAPNRLSKQRSLQTAAALGAPAEPLEAAQPVEPEHPAEPLEAALSVDDSPVMTDDEENDDADSLSEDERPDPVLEGSEPSYTGQTFYQLPAAVRQKIRHLFGKMHDQASWDLLQVLLAEHQLGLTTEAMETLISDVCPAVVCKPLPVHSAQAEASFIQEEEETTLIRRMNDVSMSPSYIETLLVLPHGWNEEAILTHCLGDTIETVIMVLRDSDVHDAYLGLNFRASLLERWDKYFRWKKVPSLRRRWKFLAQRPVILVTEPVQQSPRCYTKNPYIGKFFPSLAKGDLSAKVRATMSAREILQQEYTKLVLLIIADAIPLFQSLHLPIFGLVPPASTPAVIAKVYGAVFTRKVSKGKLSLRGCRNYWRRLLGLLNSAIELQELTADLVLSYIDATNISGHIMGWTLQWAGLAFGQDLLSYLGKSPVIQEHVKGDILGHAVGRDKKPTKHAPYVPDEFVIFLSDCCHSDRLLVAGRAAFFYFLCVGGMRGHDGMRVTKIEFGSYCIILTCSKLKTSTQGGDDEVIVIPLLDYRGRSLRPAFELLRQQMGTYFLLANPVALSNGRLEAPLLLADGHSTPCTPTKMNDLFRFFAQDYNAVRHKYRVSADAPIPMECPEDTLTTHSPKSWLDTFAVQAGFDDRAVDMLCHWNRKTMQKLYNRNYSGVELSYRMTVIRLFQSTWRSRGEGLPMRPPVHATLPPVPNEPTDFVEVQPSAG